MNSIKVKEFLEIYPYNYINLYRYKKIDIEGFKKDDRWIFKDTATGEEIHPYIIEKDIKESYIMMVYCLNAYQIS